MVNPAQRMDAVGALRYDGIEAGLIGLQQLLYHSPVHERRIDTEDEDALGIKSSEYRNEADGRGGGFRVDIGDDGRREREPAGVF